jgi:PKD repeat protein
MAINYPDSPTLGQTASYSNGNLVVWNGNSWRVSSSPITTYGTASLDFGFTASQEGDTTTATVSNVNTKLTSLIIINSSTSSNHQSVEDSLIEDIKYEISDKIEGVGFTIYAYAPMGTWGEYNIEYKIIN